MTWNGQIQCSACGAMPPVPILESIDPKTKRKRYRCAKCTNKQVLLKTGPDRPTRGQVYLGAAPKPPALKPHPKLDL